MFCGLFGGFCGVARLAGGLAAVGLRAVAVGLRFCGLQRLLVVVLRLGEEVAEYVLDYLVDESQNVLHAVSGEECE